MRARDPAGLDTLPGGHARAPLLPGLSRAQGSDRLAVDEGVLSPRSPRAQGGDKTGLVLPAQLRIAVLRVEVLAPGIDAVSTLCVAHGLVKRARPRGSPL